MRNHTAAVVAAVAYQQLHLNRQVTDLKLTSPCTRYYRVNGNLLSKSQTKLLVQGSYCCDVWLNSSDNSYYFSHRDCGEGQVSWKTDQKTIYNGELNGTIFSGRFEGRIVGDTVEISANRHNFLRDKSSIKTLIFDISYELRKS